MKTLWKYLILSLFAANCFASESSISAPKFECDLPAFRTSGDATNEVRQLRKIEKRYNRCVETYKSKLRHQRANIVKIQQKTTGTAKLENIEAALTIIDHVLASDFKPKGKSPNPTPSDIGNPNHGG